jgi:uncharacterized damage-inducible protein DinB
MIILGDVRVKTLKCYIALAAAATLSYAQNPLSTGQKVFYGMVAANVVAAAEKMPEASYSFKPTPEVRSFGELVGHTADAQNMFCAVASGEKAPMVSIEKTKTSKADLIDAVKQAVAFCDKVYGSVTDDHASELVTMFGRQMAKLTVLTVNTAHLDEHYGNMVTYMRIRGLVPPSSEPRK